ncbi:hypothetical protein D3C87_2022770 [compost metagenome]
MSRLFQQVPVETLLEVPFRSLAEFATHKHELRARVREHVREHQPQVRKPLPFVARHFIEERFLAVNNLVV